MSAGAVSHIVTPPDPAVSGNELHVTAGEGARYLSDIDQLPFTALIWPVQTIPIFGPSAGANAERVTVTAIDGDKLTFERSDHPVALLAGWQVAVLATMPSYDYGATATLVSTTEATVFALAVRDPQGRVSEPNTGGSATHPLALTTSGIWHYRWTADGVPQTEQALFARYSAVLP